MIISLQKAQTQTLPMILAEIPENQARYEAFVKTYGTAFNFIEPPATNDKVG